MLADAVEQRIGALADVSIEQRSLALEPALVTVLIEQALRNGVDREDAQPQYEVAARGQRRNGCQHELGRPARRKRDQRGDLRHA